uniref:CSON015264 protein n=1 Tax=Culicoides sonorensis TaxID=179676 RepID=A0A336M0Z3_CULSO
MLSEVEIKSKYPNMQDIPQKILESILEHLDVDDQHEAAMVNSKWFESIYNNPRNKKIQSILFGNCYLNDSEAPLCYFLDTKIPYKRLIFGHNVKLDVINKFCAKMGETVEDLVIKRSANHEKIENFPLTAGRVADILGHMKKLNRLELEWSLQNKFLNGETVFHRQNAGQVKKVLQNVTEFKITARDVSHAQLTSFLNIMKNLEYLYIHVSFSHGFVNEGNVKPMNWKTILDIVKRHASTLRHLFVDLRSMEDRKEMPVNKNMLLGELLKIHNLHLESFAIHLPNDYHPPVLCQFFLKMSSTLKTIGCSFENEHHSTPMLISSANFQSLLKCVPNLKNITIEISHGFLRDITLFQHLPNLASLNIYTSRFDRQHHICHRIDYDIPFDHIVPHPKMKELKVVGEWNNSSDHVVACGPCILYIALSYPNITRLELNININDSIGDYMMHLIFHHLKHLEILGLSTCKEVTDDAFTGTLSSYISKKRQNEEFSISNLKKLHTLVLFSIENITNISFIDGFAKLPHLKRLILGGVYNISESGIEALADGCPNLEIIFFDGCTNMDDRFVTFLLNRLIYLKLLRLNGSLEFTDKLKEIKGLEITPNCGSNNLRSIIWKYYNAYKINLNDIPFKVNCF